MKESFRDDLRLSKKNQEQLQVVNSIIEEYAEQGYILTLRQLYYQLVSRDVIANKQSEYAKLSTLLVKGRMAGVVDWNAIEDRIRVPFIPYSVDDIDDAINDTINQYRLNRQDGQDVYIELWVEKDALSGVLKRITSKYHINLMVNRGYSSCSAMHDAYERLERQESEGKKTVILYLGDHDPSGLDMIRDIEERLNEFGVNPEVRQIGLTMKQIKKYNPPPNPAKITDPRARNYIAEFGNVSWEVDALTPEVLHKLVQDNVEELIDMDLFNDKIIQEEKDKEKLQEFADKNE
jgi:hypothetical protein|tara:strand:+ start:120 stop:995 length:876 start_codon:yes stop_codon:yes gene_type:complete